MNVRVIPTKVHGTIDYVSAPALIAAPDLLRLDGARASALAPRLAGASAAVYSALTDYELGLRRVIPVRVHLLLDALAGTALVLGPWVFGSARRGSRHWLPHALAGGAEIGLALTTKTEPRRTGLRRALWALREAAPAVAALPPSRRAGVLALPVVLVVFGYAARRRLFQGLAVAAEAVEEAGDAVEHVGDAVEKATDSVEGVADDLAEAARERVAESARPESE